MVTRGNVAIYCYNALTAKTWDVTSSEDGKLTSSKTGDTILAKYFSDFVNEDGQMKLVEDATVETSGANTTAIGKNQIKITGTAENLKGEDVDIATFIEADDEPRKGKEEVTYAKGTGVVAYVPENVADISTLQGKTVDVIFGKDNEVAYVVVTDDAIDRVYVTAWDYTNEEEAEIELDGETYEVLPEAEVYVLGYEVDKDAGADWTAIQVIDEIITKSYNFNVTKPTKTFNRNIVADVILSEDNEVKSINLIGSTNVTDAPIVVLDKDGKEVETTLNVEEVVVKKVSDAGRVTTILGSSAIESKKLETLDEKDVTVIKAGDVISAEEIKAGDVLTILTIGNNTMPEKIYVSDTRVEGNVDSFKNTYSILTIDGENYNVSNPIFNKDGDIEEATAGSFAAKEFYNVEVEAYLNFMGEISALVGETSAVDSAFGIIASTPYYEKDKGDDPDYIAMKILTEDGKRLTYTIYNSESEDSILDTTAFTFESDTVKYEGTELAIGNIVTFTADDERAIFFDDEEYEDNEFAGFAVASTTNKGTVTVEGEELTVVVVPETFEYKKSGKYLSFEFDSEKDGNEKFYFDDTVSFNTNTVKVDDIKNPSVIKWSNLVDGNVNVFAAGQLLYVDKDNAIKYFAANLSSYASESTDAQYAIVLTTTPVDTDEYEVTLFVDGEEIVALYEDTNAEDLAEGDLVTFTMEDDETYEDIVVVTNVDDIYVADDEDAIAGITTLAKGNLVVKKISNGAIWYEEYEEDTEETLGLCEDEEYIIYYVTKDGYEMLTDIDEVVGKYVFGYKDADCDCTDGEVNVLVVIDVK